MNESVKIFFNWSDYFDILVTKQLEHVRRNWDLTWDHSKEEYDPEEDSYGELINELISEISLLEQPEKYHDNEDCLAEYCISNLGWNIKKEGNRWVGHEYKFILEQGGFGDINEKNLVLAACGRVHAAIDNGQLHFDDMEKSHRIILADVLAIILYHRDST